MKYILLLLFLCACVPKPDTPKVKPVCHGPLIWGALERKNTCVCLEGGRIFGDTLRYVDTELTEKDCDNAKY